MTTTEPTLAELDAAWRRSDSQPILIYKHSRTCPVSAMALMEIHEFLESRGPDHLLVTVQDSREVADAIAERSGIDHGTPQALLVSGGEVVLELNGWKIKAARLEAALDSLQS